MLSSRCRPTARATTSIGSPRATRRGHAKRGPGGGTADRAVPMAAANPTASVLEREEVRILPTKIVDRFGNTVTYTYDPAEPASPHAHRGERRPHADDHLERRAHHGGQRWHAHMALCVWQRPDRSRPAGPVEVAHRLREPPRGLHHAAGNNATLPCSQQTASTQQNTYTGTITHPAGASASSRSDRRCTGARTSTNNVHRNRAQARKVSSRCNRTISKSSDRPERNQRPGLDDRAMDVRLRPGPSQLGAELRGQHLPGDKIPGSHRSGRMAALYVRQSLSGVGWEAVEDGDRERADEHPAHRGQHVPTRSRWVRRIRPSSVDRRIREATKPRRNTRR